MAKLPKPVRAVTKMDKRSAKIQNKSEGSGKGPSAKDVKIVDKADKARDKVLSDSKMVSKYVDHKPKKDLGTVGYKRGKMAATPPGFKSKKK